MTALTNKIQQIAEKDFPVKIWKTMSGYNDYDMNEPQRKERIRILTEALKDRELLELAMKELNPQSNWIKIEEGCEMPHCDWDKSEYVLVAMPNRIYPSLFYQGRFYTIETWSEDGIESDTFNPTHWMPLPKHPKP